MAVNGEVRREQVSARWAVVPLLVASAGVLLSWQEVPGGSPAFHTGVEAMSALVAAVVAVLAYSRHRTESGPMPLYVALAFTGAAVLDGTHAVVSVPVLFDSFPVPVSHATQPTWMAGRCLLAAVLLCGVWAVRRQWRCGPSRLPRRLVIRAAGGVVAVVCLALVVPAVRGAATWSGSLARPEELLPGALLALALAGHLHHGAWRSETADLGLAVSMGIGCVTQLVVIPFSSGLHDGPFVVAHLLKLASYSALLGALLVGFHGMLERVENLVVAQRRALALQRVGAAIRQMHREEDFDAVVEVIGEELLGLGVDADAIGINLFDLQRQEKRQYVVTRFQPPYVDVESCDQPAVQTLMAYWRRQEVWERAPNEEFMLAVADVDAFAEDEPQSIVDVPFRHGTIAAGVPTPIGANAELIGLLQEIAGSVSLGYERALDLAARRAAEAQLQRSRQNERLVSERNRVFREKAAAASHELLNPLSIIRGNLELSLTRDHTLPPTVVTSLNLALRASGRVEAMVRAMATKQTFQTADYAGGRIADLRIPANGSEPT